MAKRTNARATRKGRTAPDLLQDVALEAVLASLDAPNDARRRGVARLLVVTWGARELADEESDQFLREAERLAHKFFAHVHRSRWKGLLRDSPLIHLVPPPAAGLNDQEAASGLIARAELAIKYAPPAGEPDKANAAATAHALHGAVVALLPTYAPAKSLVCLSKTSAQRARCKACPTIAAAIAKLLRDGKTLDGFAAAKAALSPFVSAVKARDLVNLGRAFAERSRRRRE